ncbi:hypothetical protein [Klebsiella pneumoniae]
MYAAAGATGVKAIKDVGVALETAVDATGDTTTGSTAVENLIRDLQLPKVVKELRRNGINVFGKDGKMRSLPTLMEEIAKKSGNKGAETQNARLLGAGFNQDSILLLSSVTSGKGAENLKRYNGVVADGQGIMKDAEYASKDFTSAVTALTTTWKKFANSNLAKPVQELADAINSVDQETVQRWLEIGKNIAIAVGGVIAARKAFQFGKGVWDVLNPNKGKGIPNGIADVFGSGVMPVYVTNWPAGGLGGTGEDKVNDLLDTTADLPGWPGMLARGGLIASKLMGLTDIDPFSDEGREELLKRVQQNNERSTMWEDIKNFFTSSSPSPAGYQDPSPWASMQPQNQPGYLFLQQPELKGSIEVSVKDDRVQVTSVKVNAPGVTMSASSGVRNMEQQ